MKAVDVVMSGMSTSPSAQDTYLQDQAVEVSFRRGYQIAIQEAARSQSLQIHAIFGRGSSHRHSTAVE